MDWYWFVGLAFVIAMFLAVAKKANKPQRPTSLYRRRGVLFTPAERSFLGVLDQAVRGRYRVFGKVRIADVLAPIKGLDNSSRTAALNRIRAKHFDFVLCDPSTMEVKAVIELNDKSHTRRNRVQRDEFVGQVCAEAGLPLRMVKNQKAYSLQAIKQLIDNLEASVSARPDNERQTGQTLAAPIR